MGPPREADGRRRRTPHESPGGPGFRADIEGLRAIAVILVILYHFEIGPFEGGLVGVDVFFVLSGFLITSLLVREMQRTDHISLANFWARRMRRLLPASALVIVATLVAGRALLSPIELRNLGHDALAASTFVINMVFGRRASDYLGAQAAEASPSALLHFWSLAVEEQFYVIWPLIVFSLRRAHDRMRALGTAVGGLLVISLVASLFYTDRAPVWAFYLLPTRAWELLVGAGLALIGARVVRIPEQVRAAMGWAGIGGIVIASLIIEKSTPFPGVAALLPVLATAAVVAAGGAITPRGPLALLRAVPLQWIGRHSYAIYLWHWPVFVLASAKWGPLSMAQRVGGIAISGALAAISLVLLEDPVRHSRWLSEFPRRSIAMGACLVAVGALVSVVTFRQSIATGTTEVAAPDLGLDTGGDAGADTDVDNEADTDPTTDPGSEAPTASAATTPAAPASTTAAVDASRLYTLDELLERNAPIVRAAIDASEVPANLTPGFDDISKDLPSIYTDGCLLDPGQVKAPECVFGDPNSSTRVALVGDSHAAQWFPAFEQVAKKRGWRLTIHVKKGCAMAEFVTYDESNRRRTECGPWRKDVMSRLDREKPDLIVTATYRYRLTNRPARADAKSVWTKALTPTLTQLSTKAPKVLFLGDIPHPESWPATCLSRNSGSAQKCVMTRSKAERKPVVDAEIAASEATGVAYEKVSDWMCDDTRCAVMLGNIQLYRDDNHIGATASRYFAPFVEAVTVPRL